jgi:hypothetical protein
MVEGQALMVITHSRFLDVGCSKLICDTRRLQLGNAILMTTFACCAEPASAATTVKLARACQVLPGQQDVLSCFPLAGIVQHVYLMLHCTANILANDAMLATLFPYGRAVFLDACSLSAGG